MSVTNNICLLTDSYKPTHAPQYPKGCDIVSSFFTSRGGYPDVVAYGFSYFIQEYLAKRVTKADVDEAREVYAAHFGDASLFNYEGWMRIVEVHGGRLPLNVRTVDEGTVLGPQHVMMTVENTDYTMPWLTNYVESLLVQAWYPCSVASRSRRMRKVILTALEETGDPSMIDFKLHDFGFRGSTSVESAALGGAAHLVNFLGTDNVPALMLARKYYGAAMAGVSIPASEHSTITSWGAAHEVDAFRNMLEQYPTGLVACVSDSYDIFNACRNLWGTQLREQILARDGVLVVRPDSGDPVSVVPKVLEILGERFGYERNAKGFKVLNPKVRVIQGDGIDELTVPDILGVLTRLGWSADNLAFGSGGGLLQKGLDRDTHKFAFKASAIRLNGYQWRDVYKAPVTDPGKWSPRGRLALVHGPEGFRTVRREDIAENENLLRTRFLDGSVYDMPLWSEIRARVVA